MTDELRRQLPRRLRFEILRRDNYTCRYCGASAPDVVLTVDHVIPVALGGGDEPNNLVTACRPCNDGKASTSPDENIVEDVDATAMLFAQAMKRAAEIRRLERADLRKTLDAFEALWTRWAYDDPQVPVPKPDDWWQSIERFLDNGLQESDLDYYVQVAMTARVPATDVWRYFCGCCWKEISRRTELARRLIEDGEV